MPCNYNHSVISKAAPFLSQYLSTIDILKRFGLPLNKYFTISGVSIDFVVSTLEIMISVGSSSSLLSCKSKFGQFLMKCFWGEEFAVIVIKLKCGGDVKTCACFRGLLILEAVWVLSQLVLVSRSRRVAVGGLFQLLYRRERKRYVKKKEKIWIIEVICFIGGH